MILKKFREQSLALGVCWIIFGVLAILLGFLSEMRIRESSFWDLETYYGGTVLIIQGLLLLGFGIGTLLKKRAIIIVGLIFTYVSLVESLVLGVFTIPAVIFTIAIIAQAHRLLNWSNVLRQRGVSLSASIPRAESASLPGPSPYANLALITGILLFLTPCFFVPMTLGLLGLRDIKKHPNRTGRHRSIAGLVLSLFSLFYLILSILSMAYLLSRRAPHP